MKALVLCLALFFPTESDYPRHYVVWESIYYRVQTESDRPEWYFEDEDIWMFSEDYPTERSLLSSEGIERLENDP